MSREIKFRAWDGTTMYQVTQLRLDTGAVSRRASTTTHVRVSNPVLMQYTGLKDENGVEIYEGDICKYYDDSDDDGEVLTIPREYIGEVTFSGGCFLVGGTRWFTEPMCEIIGNIYENGDLLK